MPSPPAYFEATRPFSFTASVIPSFMGSMIALMMHGSDGRFSFHWALFALTVVGSVAVQASCNLINDYYDWRRHVDRPDNFGARNTLVVGTLTPGQLVAEAAVLMAAALLIGLAILSSVGPELLWFVLIGFLSAVFYSAPPFGLKYRGLGDLQVILSFGSIMTLGAYYVQAHVVVPFSWTSIDFLKVIVYSLPIGLLVDAILHANNHRDIEGDRASGTRTLATVLGEGPSRAFEYALVLGAYAAVVLMVVFAHLTPLALIVLLTLPKARVVLVKIGGRGKIDAAAFNMVDVDAAQLHLAFGLALTMSFLISFFTHI
jgi:1,4-dihydroxy-2-naphthoate octaprenyltransferase